MRLDYTNAENGTGVYSNCYLPAASQLTLFYPTQAAMDIEIRRNYVTGFAPPELYYYWPSEENDADIS